MINYLARVELHDAATNDGYETLHMQMQQRG